MVFSDILQPVYLLVGTCGREACTYYKQAYGQNTNYIITQGTASFIALFRVTRKLQNACTSLHWLPCSGTVVHSKGIGSG